MRQTRILTKERFCVAGMKDRLQMIEVMTQDDYYISWNGMLIMMVVSDFIVFCLWVHLYLSLFLFLSLLPTAENVFPHKKSCCLCNATAEWYSEETPFTYDFPLLIFKRKTGVDCFWVSLISILFLWLFASSLPLNSCSWWWWSLSRSLSRDENLTLPWIKRVTHPVSITA